MPNCSNCEKCQQEITRECLETQLKFLNSVKANIKFLRSLEEGAKKYKARFNLYPYVQTSEVLDPLPLFEELNNEILRMGEEK